MPILSCAIPSYPLALLARTDPAILEKPYALIGVEERVLTLTRPAWRAGVRQGQTARQARIACPDLSLQYMDECETRAEFETLLGLLDDYSNAVEPSGLGYAYLDAPDLTATTAVSFCQDVGRRLRQELGETLQPAIGCDQGKFTALAAARHTRPGAVRVVLGDAEAPFLRPLPVRLLPLPDEHHRLLVYLGIRTLGQFADLPSRAVFQQFGHPGRLAQCWAQGQDDRPVRPRNKPLNFTRTIEFELPLQTAPPLLSAAESLLAPLLSHLQNQLQAAQMMQATLFLDNGHERVDTWRLPAPTANQQRLLQLLSDRWQATAWENPVSSLSLSLSDIQEAPGDQLLLFPGNGTPVDQFRELVSQLRGRYGPDRLLRAEMLDPLRLRVEHRVCWQEFSA